MDIDEIIVVERPESVTWEQISALLRCAHEDNVANGIRLPYPFLPPEVLQEKTEGAGGKMLVALHNGALVGTGAVKIVDMNNRLWCGAGEYAYCFLAAVHPEYAGQGIYRRIEEAQERVARSWGIGRMLFDTDERNARIIKISKKNDYRVIDCRIREDHNSVLLVKWLDGCPYSKLKCAYVFWRRKSDRLKKAGKQNAAANRK